MKFRSAIAGAWTMRRRVSVLLAGKGVAALMSTTTRAAWPAGGATVIKDLTPEPDSLNPYVPPTTVGATVKDKKTNLAKRHITHFFEGAKVLRSEFSYHRGSNRLS